MVEGGFIHHGTDRIRFVTVAVERTLGIAAKDGDTKSGSVSSWIPIVVSCTAYFLLALYAYSHVSIVGSGSLPVSSGGDQAQEVWFLAWPAFAVTHGHNPFFTNWMNYPPGVNLAINTSMPLLGILGLPITLTLGPVATYNALLVIGFTASALTMCLVLRRWVRSRLAAFIGGLLYGFSPYMIGEGNGHLFLTFIPIPPLIFLVLDEIVVRQERSILRYGILLGCLASAQYYISPEVFAMSIVIGLVGLVIVMATHPYAVRDHFHHALGGLVVAGITCGLTIAYGIWFSLFGPQHVVGPPHSLAGLELYPGDLLGGIIPTASQHMGPVSLKAIGDHLTGGDVTENGMYLGIPLLGVLAVLTGIFRKVSILVYSMIMLLVSYVLALGHVLTVDGYKTGVPLPFAVLLHMPLAQDILPVRFSLFIQLFAAMALGIGLDQIWRKAVNRPAHAQYSVPRHQSHRKALSLLVAAFAIVPLVPEIPYAGAPTAIPPLLAGTGRHQIPFGSTVLSYPYPVDFADEVMLLQASDGMGFKIIGGYSFIPLPGGSSSTAPTVLVPSTVEAIYLAAYEGVAPGQAYPPVDAATVAELRVFLHRYKVSTILVYRVGKNPTLVMRYTKATIGQPQRQRKGYLVWFNVQHLLASHGTSSR